MIDPHQEAQYKEAQKRVRHAHDQAKRIIEELEHADNNNQVYVLSGSDEHIIREYSEAWHHLSDTARNYLH